MILDYVNDPNCSGDIYYTNDGANPTTSSNLYSSPLILSQNIGGGNLIIKANVFGTNSEGNSISTNLRTQTYNFKVASPTVSLESGTYSSSQNVALSTITNGAEIRYTTNGSEPSPFSPLYTTPINISTTTTLKIKAFKTGYNSSEVVSRNYIIETESSVCSLSGSGTIFDPYLIRTPFDLHCINEKQIALNLEGPGGVLEYFLLENDIDLKHNSLLPYSWYQSSGFPSIGALDYTDTQWDCYGDFYFKGHFDGGGHTIANVYINREFINQSDIIVDCDPAYSDFTHQKASLFGILSLGSSIKNLNLENIYINLSADQVFQHSLGGLSNKSVTTSQITDVNISGIVKISGNYDADISAQQVGGVVGLNGGLIRNVSFDGNVFGCNNVGGIVGSNDYLGEVILSKAKGLINGAGIGIGGVVGTNKKKVSECFFDGNIVGKNNVGGIVGEHKGLSNSLIENSYVKSNIISSVDTDIYPGRFFGGIVGRVSPNLESELIPVNRIINSYSVSKLPDFSAVHFNSACGGVGYLTGVSFVPNYGSGSYNNLSSLVNPDYCDYMNAHENYGFLGKSTNFMKNLNNFVGWNTGIWIINPSINEGYPYLRNNPPN